MFCERFWGAANDVKQGVPGNFSGGQQRDLLFYDPDGHVGCYSVDNGTIHLLEANTGWHGDWDLIVPGNFSDGQYADLLFYSQARDVWQFYRTNHRAIAQIGLYTDWRHTWTQILLEPLLRLSSRRNRRQR